MPTSRCEPASGWVLRLVALVAGTALGVILFNGGFWMNIFGIVLGFGLGYFVPAIVLRFLSGRRAKKFERQLPGRAHPRGQQPLHRVLPAASP